MKNLAQYRKGLVTLLNLIVAVVGGLTLHGQALVVAATIAAIANSVLVVLVPNDRAGD